MLFGEGQAAKQARQDVGLYNKLALGINRPLRDVYVKVRQICNPRNYKGEFTEEEKERLYTLQKQYGNKWEMIGEEMGRTGASVQHKFKKIKIQKETENGEVKNLIQQGRWLKAEISKLEQAVLELTGSENRQSVGEQKIKWDAVAHVVGTRHPEQCRTKWYLELSWKKPGEKLRKWKDSDRVQFVAELLKCGAQSEKLVEWELIAGNMRKPVSIQYMKRKWYDTKKLVPNYQALEFHEILDWLQKNCQ